MGSGVGSGVSSGAALTSGVSAGAGVSVTTGAAVTAGVCTGRLAAMALTGWRFVSVHHRHRQISAIKIGLSSSRTPNGSFLGGSS